MKQTLENILNSAKKIGKKAVAVGATIAMLYTPVKAAPNIYMWNSSSSGIYTNTFVNGYNDGAKEGEDSLDCSYLEAPPSPKLEITSNEPGFRAEWNNKPRNTPYSEAEFFVEGTVAGPIDNSVTFYVEDPNGDFEHRFIIAYDINDPYNLYYPNKKHGFSTNIPLLPLQDKQDEVYATWHIIAPPINPGDCASALGVGKLDGEINRYDIKCIGDEWLEETLEGENYLDSDVNYDRITNFEDFAIIANSYSEQ